MAYVVGVADVAAPSLLRNYLKTYPPEYMVPSHFEALSDPPLLPNGKIDPHALPPPSTVPLRQRDFELPGTLAEQALAGVWT